MKKFAVKSICTLLSVCMVGSGIGQVIGQYKYNVFGEIKQTIDEGGLYSEVLEYNVFGQPALIKDREGNLMHVEYNHNGEVASSWFDRSQGDQGGNNLKISSSYDKLGRTISTDNTETQRKYTYNQDGSVKSISYLANNHVYQYVFSNNDTNRSQSIEYSIDGVLSYQKTSWYNQTGTKVLASELKDMAHNQLLEVVTYDYDALHSNRLSQTHKVFYDKGEVKTILNYRYHYDAINRVSGFEVFDNNKKIYSEEYVRNDLGQMERFIQDYGDNKKTISHYTYGVLQDNNGASQVLFSYQIDDSSTIFPKMKMAIDGKEQEVKLLSQSYDYTANFGLKSIISKVQTTQGEIREISYQYHYDATYPDRIKQIDDSSLSYQLGSFGYDKNGNVTEDAWGNRYTHNPLNQLTLLTSSGGDQKRSIEYRYNINGQVSQSTPLGDPSKAVEYFYFGDQLIGQKQDGVSANYFGNSTYYDEAHRANDRVNIINFREDVVASKLLHSDDEKGNLIQYLYTPYGQQTVLSMQNAAVQKVYIDILDNIFGYTNQIFDASANANMMGGKRLWDPKYGISFTHDTVNVDNKYMTMRGNPMAYIDPTGNISMLVIGAWALVGAAIGFGTTAINAHSEGVPLRQFGWYMRKKGWIDVSVGAVSAALGAGVSGPLTSITSKLAGEGAKLAAKKLIVTLAVDTAIGAATSAGQQGLYMATKNQQGFDGGGFAMDMLINTGISMLTNAKAVYKSGPNPDMDLSSHPSSASLPDSVESNSRGTLTSELLESAATPPESPRTITSLGSATAPNSAASPSATLGPAEGAASGACFVAGTVVWVRRRREDGSSRFLGEMFAEYEIVEIEVQGEIHEIILLPIELIKVGDEVLSMPEDYRPELDEKVA